jgi:BirA family biotin operon repressor/biotin-[acetyl-CoA-carboxylase] ligase
VSLFDRRAPVHVHETVGSTNDLALALAAQGAPDFTAVLADQQTAGRGRRGRTWWSPPGAGLYLSVVVRPDLAIAHVPVMTLAAGVALVEAIRAHTGVAVELKWPNDLVIGRPWRKLAGILCEATGLGTVTAAVIVGMGVNLRRSAYPPEIADRVTSLAEECPVELDRDVMAGAVLDALEQQVSLLRAGRVDDVLRRWRSAAGAALDAAPVRWRDADGDHRGTTVGLADDGALLVREPGQPASTRIVSGEVIWEMLNRA